MANSRTFTDLDLNFVANPATGDVASKYDANAIKQSIKNLVLTKNYERPFHPEIGSQVQSLLFDQMSPMTQAMMEESIRNTILNYEPRVNLRKVAVKFNNDNNAAFITILFTILNTVAPLTVDITLKRTR